MPLLASTDSSAEAGTDSLFSSIIVSSICNKLVHKIGWCIWQTHVCKVLVLRTESIQKTYHQGLQEFQKGSLWSSQWQRGRLSVYSCRPVILSA